MSLVNSMCAEVNIFQGIGERTGTIIERKALRGRKGLCKSMRDLASKARVLGDGFYYVPENLWPENQESVVLNQLEWTTMTSVSRASKRSRQA